uniref:Uncharacterized protein n=1 Tax=Arundo donax TaxID=35708 RepID=A0A0A9GDR0_ARUDO
MLTEHCNKHFRFCKGVFHPLVSTRSK